MASMIERADREHSESCARHDAMMLEVEASQDEYERDLPDADGSCEICTMRGIADGIEARNHAEHVLLGSVLISEEPDRTVARIYKPLTSDQRQRLLSLLGEISGT
jgi:hypothetical protein